jgi:hypothetical protein
VQVTEGTPTWHSCVRMMDSCSHTHVCRHGGLNLSNMKTFGFTLQEAGKTNMYNSQAKLWLGFSTEVYK